MDSVYGAVLYRTMSSQISGQEEQISEYNDRISTMEEELRRVWDFFFLTAIVLPFNLNVFIVHCLNKGEKTKLNKVVVIIYYKKMSSHVLSPDISLPYPVPA